MLAGHWPGLYLDGQPAVIHELLAGRVATGEPDRARSDSTGGRVGPAQLDATCAA
jgi:hypothetical protein